MCAHIRRFAWISALCIVSLYPEGGPCWANMLSKHDVRVNGVVIDVKEKEPPVPELLESRVRKGPRKWIVQFAGPIHAEQKASVEALGCRLHDYLPDFAFLATMDEAVKEAVMQLPYIEGVARFKPAHKLHEKLRARAVAPPAAEKVRIHLQLDDPANLNSVLTAVGRMGGQVLDVGRDKLRVAVDTATLSDLAALEEVNWIDEHVEMQLLNDTSHWTIQSYLPGDTRIWDRGIHGEGQIVGIGDTGLDHDMPWFSDPGGAPIGAAHRKIVGYDQTYGDDYDADYPGHGTHVAGTVGGDRGPVDGGSNASGMAPKSRLFIQDLTPGSSGYVFPPVDLGQMFAAAHDAGARLHTNSWGSSGSAYGPYAASADRYLWEHKEFLALFANGNAGPGVGTVGNPATAKNVISVGATYNGSSAENMAIFSSNGPTADGRIKPTVTAPGYSIISADSDGLKESGNSGTIGMSGTSMATPTVAGAAALVRQYFTDGYHPAGTATPSAAFLPSAALVKSVLINSAQAMTGTGIDGPIPATGQGWGRINLANALLFAGDSRRLEVVEESTGLVTGAGWNRDFFVSQGEPFKVTLVWTDYPGATGAAKALVNDLDLAVTAPDGTVFLGNAFADGASVIDGTPDRLNVEEQVLVNSPGNGLYTVSVTGYNVPYGPQPFAMAVTGAMGVTSRGVVTLARKSYTSQGVLDIRLADRDLIGNPASADLATVLVTSATEPAGETVVLTEGSPDSGIFLGRLSLAPGGAAPHDGRLQVADRDTITVTYQDADDGSGRAATATATATVDDMAPTISSLAVNGITDTAASITWNTDEPSSSVLNFGDTPAMGGTTVDRRLTTQHSISLSALKEGATCYVSVTSTDEAGNTTGSPITFATLNLPPYLTASSSEGNTTSQPVTVISGVSTDPSGVVSVTINGTDVTRRASDGFYSLPVDLQVGDNLLTITASDSLGNTASVTVAVTRIPPADLLMQAVIGPPSGVQKGTIPLEDTVCNGGPGDASSFQIGFYLSADQMLSNDDILFGSRTVASLAAGACSGWTTQLTIPATAAGGPLYLIGYADYTNRQVETNKGNNTLAGNLITLPYIQLAAPGALTVPATNSTGSFQVYWSSSNVSGATYVLEYSTDDGSAFTGIYSGTSTSSIVTVPASGTYTFRVKATKANYADSAYSATRSCTVALACGVPPSLTVPATNSTGSFQVYWGSSSVGGVTYALEYSTDDGSTFTGIYSGTSTSANVTVPASGIYTFRVKATKANYADSAYSATRSCTVTLACGVPPSLTVPATNSTGSFQVYWGSSSVGGVTYVLEYSTNGSTFTGIYSGTSTSANVTVPVSGIYTFRVKAIKANYADSAYSGTRSCTVALACGVPPSLTVPATNSTGSFRVYWGSCSVSGATYVLEYSTNGSTYTGIYSGTSTSANVTVPVSGIYTFRVKAIKANYADSAYSGTRSCTVALACGIPPSLAAPATNSTGSFRVSWGSSNVSGVTYVLEYSTNNGGSYIRVYSGTSTYANVTVPVSGTYTFRVKATRANYADSAYSATSSCAVALACAAPPSISVPGTNSTGSFRVSWSSSNVSGVTYVLEYCVNNGSTFIRVYNGTSTYANVTVPASGAYTFRVKATKANYADSPWKVSTITQVGLNQ